MPRSPAACSCAPTEGVFNRLLWATPDGGLQHYDKRHLFRYAGEHKRYAAGRQAADAWNGKAGGSIRWSATTCASRCIRATATTWSGQARWISTCSCSSPTGRAARAYAWKTLLRARAIENLCYVAAVNRVGVDGNGLEYSGDSALIDFLGQPLIETTDEEGVVSSVASAAGLAAHRERFPAMLDGDAFSLD